jgi:hypothetical protein
MKTLSVLSLSIVLASGFSIPAFASKEGHGGHVVKCAGQPAVTLDYFEAKLPALQSGQRPLYVYNPDLGRDLISFLVNRGLNPKNVESVGKIEDWTAASLNPVSDHGIPYELPPGCQLLQGAVRTNGTQYGDPNVISLLSNGQKDLLVVHEALYGYLQLCAEAGGNEAKLTSQPVRKFLKILLNIDATDSEIEESFTQLNDYCQRLMKKAP